MIEIDGSIGGGQLLRTAIGLSTLTNLPVKVTNIRKGKDAKPGLLPQHMTGVKIAGEFCNAEITGLKQWSLEVEFKPDKLEVRDRKIDIGTAGSITLLLQTLLPILVFNKKPVRLEIIGGTEVKWAPTIQYMDYVLLPMLRKMGANISLEIVKHGYYPVGGGDVIAQCEPIKKLQSISCVERGNIKGINIESVCGSLPKDVAERQTQSALGILKDNYPDVKFSVRNKVVQTLSPGSSVTCYAVCDNSILGGSALGERGVKAEKVGMMAAEELLTTLKSNGAVDKYLADQMLVFMALADGRSEISVEKITEHVLTNIQVIEKFLPVKFEVDNIKRVVSVNGISFSL